MVSSVRRCTEYMSLLYGLKGSVITSCQALKDIHLTLVTHWTKLRKCAWPFMVPVMGLMTFSLSNQRHAWLPCHFMSFKTVI